MLINYDSSAFFGMYLSNMASELNDDGSLPDVVPALRWARRPVQHYHDLGMFFQASLPKTRVRHCAC